MLNNKVFCSGHDKLRRNNGFSRQELTQAIWGYHAISDQILSIRLLEKPINITIIQVYSPTTEDEENEMENFYISFEKKLMTQQNKT